MRLVTRGDLDGLTCALLLQEVEPIEEVALVHPKDVQDGKVDITSNDILANLPYDPRAGMWFDHHSSESEAAGPSGFKGAYAIAPSAARVIANHYDSPKFARYEELLAETDRLDAAQLTIEDVQDPKGWILLGYTIDPRTGLGGFRDYFQKLMRLCREQTIDEVLQEEEVAERVRRVKTEQQAFVQHLMEVSKLDGNVIVMDVRGMRGLPSGNRFLVYTLFPEANVSLRIADGLAGKFYTVQVGHSIFNRTCKTNVGELMHKHGGGGHRGAGTCQPTVDVADAVIADILETLKRNG
ncbi:MAG TPA: exopolyphosphatase [Chloroflexota bacterium]|nr:exopolyphosphatase [Chloroflexota bacterium]